MRFTFQRDRMISSTCGLSVSFKAGVPQLTPPAMYQEVLAAGGIPEGEIPLEPKQTDEDREALLFAAFEDIVKRNDPKDFTAGGMPHSAVVSEKVGFQLTAKERDVAWGKFRNQQT